MIKRTRQGSGLKDYISQMPFLDTNQVSKNYFRVMDFPSRFYVGKNSFRISGNDETLVNGSMIYIDVVDSNGSIVYHEILDVKNRDMSRTVIVYIYSDTPPGEITVYIAGRLKNNPVTGIPIPFSNSPASFNYKDIPNIIWTGVATVVSNKQNSSEILFIKEPKIVYHERLVSFSNISGSNYRTKLFTGSAASKISMVSKDVPIQYGNESIFQYDGMSGIKSIRPIPEITNNVGESGKTTPIPDNPYLAVIEAPAGTSYFNRNMVGGLITIQNISVSQFAPPDAQPGAFATIPTYSASIVDVRNANSIVVSNPFIFKADYTSTNGSKKQVVFNKFINHTDYNISYYNTGSLSKTFVSESFISMEITDLEPSAGAVDKLRLSYKPVGSYGDFIAVGEFPINETNLLVRSNSFAMTRENGLVAKPLGTFFNTSDTTATWSPFNIGGNSATTVAFTSDKLMNAVRIKTGNPKTRTRFPIYKIFRNHFRCAENTEYKLKFKVYSDPGSQASPDMWHTEYIDVYISGSGIRTGIINRGTVTDVEPYADNSLGTFIGTVDAKYGNQQTVEMFFITDDSKYISPVFALRSGAWHLADVELIPRKEVGFSPNHAKLDIPLNRFEQNSEIIIDVDYLNNDGVEANLDSRLYGVFFRGGKSELSQSIVVLNQTLLDVSSSLSWRVTGTISGSDIRYFDSITADNNTPVSRLEIGGGRANAYSVGGEMALVASTQSMAGGTRFIMNNEDATRPTVNDYVQSKFMGTWDGTHIVSCSVKYPILNRSDTLAHYSGDEATDIVHLIYHIDVMAVGYSGSTYNDYQGSYIWAGTTRGRVALPPKLNRSALVYDAFVSTASMDIYDGFERFGLPSRPTHGDMKFYDIKESAFKINATHSVDSGSGTLDVQYLLNITPSSIFEQYDVYLVSSIKVLKLEFFVNRI